MSKSRHFCVVVHDVTPVFAGEINQILNQLRPWVGKQIGGAVVPRWQGRDPGSDAHRQWQRWAGDFGELLLHGCTHYRQHRPGLISWLTGRSDEFSTLSPGETRRRVIDAQSQIAAILGAPLRGLVPPAWQFPCKLSDIQSAGIDYLLRFHRLEFATGPHLMLATWSWDWGWIPGTSRTGALLGSVRHAWQPSAVPMIALHPADVRRGCLSPAVRLIRRFLRDGRHPVLPSELLGALVARERA